MRALILVATAALALSACSKNEAADNTMNVDDTMTTNEVLGNESAMNADMHAVYANMMMNGADTANAAVDSDNTAADTANAMSRMTAFITNRLTPEAPSAATVSKTPMK